MDPDEYRPDPPAGLAWSDFQAARGRYRARLAAVAEIARLERLFALNADDGPDGGGAPEPGGPRRPPSAHSR